MQRRGQMSQGQVQGRGIYHKRRYQGHHLMAPNPDPKLVRH
jgi:hypothetical protein